MDIVLREGRYQTLSLDQSVTPLLLALVEEMKPGLRCPTRLKELPLWTSGSSPANCAPHGIALSNDLDDPKDITIRTKVRISRRQLGSFVEKLAHAGGQICVSSGIPLIRHSGLNV